LQDTIQSEIIVGWRTLERNKVLHDYKQISDYALIGDQKTCALVGIDGSIDWFCVPRFDSPSVFAAILDKGKGGSFRLMPLADQFQIVQHYEGLTNILATEFKTDSGHAKLVDFMPSFKVGRTMVSAGEIHRRLTCLSGEIELEALISPRMNYGRIIPDVNSVKKIGYSFSSQQQEMHQQLALITPLRFKEVEQGTLAFNLHLRKGDQTILVLRYGGAKLHHTENTFSDVKLEQTRTYWKTWASKTKVSGKWREPIVRSALALKLLIYSPTGAIVAAPTTSLPEQIGGVRNWDYRYSWVRDSSFVLWAFHSLGHDQAEENYLDWMTSMFYLTCENLQVMLGISSERDLTERTLDHLEGYRQSTPVRVGNGAWDQFQLDVYGILLDALYFSHKHGGGVSLKVFDYLVAPLVKQVEQVWDIPDCGIWEVRGEKEPFVYSKMWCWVGLDRAVKIATSLRRSEDAQRWSKLRDEIKETILEKGWDESIGSFVRSFGTTDLDCANLLMPQLRFISGKDPRMVATIDKTIKELGEGKFLYRYRTKDGLPGEEGAFLICSFWLVSCLALAGRLKEAEELLDGLIECSNHVGLFSEEVDPKNGSMLGNYPQAFTHMGFITAAVTVSRELERRRKRRRR
jgi:alpha,alpha-trehalase